MKNAVHNITMIGLILLAAGLFVSAGCSDNDSNPAGSPSDGNGNMTGSQTVVINNFSFTPATVTISVGDKVVWRNDQSVGHTVTSDTGSELNSPLLNQGETYEHTFNMAGSYPYHCTPHPFMTATVIVQ